MSTERRALVKTWGCQMNVYDSERIGEMLGEAGYGDTDAPEDADLVILNTCHIREKAAEKIYSELGRLRQVKEKRGLEGKETRIAVMGCVAQAEGEEIMRRAPVVDMVLGPQSLHKLPGMLKQDRRSVAADFDVDEKFAKLPKTRRQHAPSAFLTVQEGCDKFCTFCVVPYTRGAEHSRKAGDIVEEAKQLLDAGVKEITLLGQNVNAWEAPGLAGDKWRLADLLAHLSDLPGMERLRYTTSHPRDMDDGLIAAHGALPKLMPYLHLPVQAGSNRVLDAMNRQHTIETYFALIEKIRAARPDIAMSGDFIVGFPGETDADFEDTMAAVRTVEHASAFSFKYSPRPGTPGAGMDDQVPEAVKTERLARLQDLLRDQQMAFNRAQIGQVLPVLFDRQGRHDGQLIGRSPYLQSVFAQAPKSAMGEIRDVKITGATQNALQGELITELVAS